MGEKVCRGVVQGEMNDWGKKACGIRTGGTQKAGKLTPLS